MRILNAFFKQLFLLPFRILNILLAPILMFIFGFWACWLIPFDKSGDLVMRYAAHPWGLVTLWFARLPVKIEGLEHLDPAQTYIFMPNHSSFYDVPIITSKIPYKVRTMAKTLFFYLPFFGFAMARARNIKIYRNNPRKDLKQLEKAAGCLKDGKSIVVFPEGTRTKDGQLQDLKNALFILPVRTGYPVVPVAITGTYEALPIGSLWLNPRPITMRFMPPIDSTRYGRKEREKFARDVKAAIQVGLDQDR